jgi:hypothetical protein
MRKIRKCSQAENQNIEANTFFMKPAILPEVDLRQ